MKKLKKYILAAAVAACAAPAAIAVPAYPGLIKVTQPDGTELEVRLRGDEHGAFVTTADNHLVIEQEGAYYFAKPGDATTPLVSTGILAVPEALRSAETNRMLGTINTQLGIDLVKSFRSDRIKEFKTNVNNSVASRAGSNILAGPSMSISNYPTKGSPKTIVILVEFQDQKLRTENAREYFQRMMMEKGFNEYGAQGSANDFFVESSRGQFNPQIEVYGPVQLKEKKRYYGRNVGGTPGADAAVEDMIIEAVRGVDSEVDFRQFDTDGDGDIDNVCVIYAGEGEATSSQAVDIWPHASYIYDNFMLTEMLDGVRLNHYICLNEFLRAYNRAAGIGTFVHEFSHVLGLPDIYDTEYNMENEGKDPVTAGSWSVMDNGPYNGFGLCPPRFSAYEAYVMGWLDPKEIAGPANCYLTPGNGEAFYIATDKPNEFYMFEARKREGFDTFLPYDGMLIWHIDFYKRSWLRNDVNVNANHHRIQLIKADNELTEKTNRNDAFPSRSGAYDKFTAETEPAFLTWDGVDLELPITDIKMDADAKITFKVAGGGDPLAIETVGSDNANSPVEWFNLQGVRVAEPKAGNIYIRRQGTDVTKQLFR